MKIIYVGNIRLPTEKAHGYQIMKMCEAFASCGTDVELWHPARLQANTGLRGTDAFTQYGVRRSFVLRKMPNIDVVALNRFIPDAFFMPFFFLHALVWGWYAAGRARKVTADVYYARDDEVAYWLLQRGLPTVYEAHGVPRRWKHWMLRSIATSPYLKCAVAVTGFLRDELIRMGFPPEKTVVAPDAADTLEFPLPADKPALRRTLHLPQNKKLVTYMGRFTTKGMGKGVDDLLEALPFFKTSAVLVLVGGSPEETHAYVERASQRALSGRVICVPFLPHAEAIRYLMASDVLLMPFPAGNEHYRLHMSPLKMFEYMASGVPIVASDLPSVREILDESMALLYDAGDTQAQIRAVNSLITDVALGAALSARARTSVLKNTWKNRAENIMRNL